MHIYKYFQQMKPLPSTKNTEEPLIGHNLMSQGHIDLGWLVQQWFKV